MYGVYITIKNEEYNPLLPHKEEEKWEKEVRNILKPFLK